MSQFTKHMDNLLTGNYQKLLSKTVRNRIKETILEFDVEKIHYKIKNGQNIEEFSAAIMNMVDELLQNNEEKKIEYDDKLVTIIYEAVSECFIDGYESGSILAHRQRWICNNCTNCNVNCFIGSELNIDLSICILC
eukprot:192329_1